MGDHKTIGSVSVGSSSDAASCSRASTPAIVAEDPRPEQFRAGRAGQPRLVITLAEQHRHAIVNLGDELVRLGDNRGAREWHADDAVEPSVSRARVETVNPAIQRGLFWV